MKEAFRRFRRIAPVVAIVALLLLTTYAGLVEGPDAMRSAATQGQRVAALTQMLYGVFAVAALIAMTLRPRFVLPILVLWGAALTVTGGLAPVVYGETGILVGVMAGVSVALLVVLVVWGWRKHSAGHG